jgi:hypothetical protein
VNLGGFHEEIFTIAATAILMLVGAGTVVPIDIY